MLFLFISIIRIVNMFGIILQCKLTNTFVHEKNHLEMHICEALDINPYSEEAAILSGETAMQILNEALYNIAEL